MAHRVALRAEADLDDIWYYVAKESGSIITLRVSTCRTWKTHLAAPLTFVRNGERGIPRFAKGKFCPSRGGPENQRLGCCKCALQIGQPRATNGGMDKTIRKYTSHKEMRADEYRYWQSRPVHERMDAVSFHGQPRATAS
jgi:hypothetical protein